MIYISCSENKEKDKPKLQFFDSMLSPSEALAGEIRVEAMVLSAGEEKASMLVSFSGGYMKAEIAKGLPLDRRSPYNFISKHGGLKAGDEIAFQFFCDEKSPEGMTLSGDALFLDGGFKCGMKFSAIGESEEKFLDDLKKMDGEIQEVYKKTPQGPLRMHIMEDDSLARGKNRPALVLFHGGGWATGRPRHFERQARHFASRGFAVFLPEYRLKREHGTSPYESVKDAKSAIRWVRQNSAKFAIDPDRIAVGGGSAGGHIAIMAAMSKDFDDEKDSQISSVPDLLVLYNPVIDTSRERGFGYGRFKEKYKEMSPMELVGPGLPPSMILLGDQDRCMKPDVMKDFVEKMLAAGNECKFILYPGYVHGFEDCIYERPPFDEAVSRSNKDVEAFLKSKNIF